MPEQADMPSVSVDSAHMQGTLIAYWSPQLEAPAAQAAQSTLGRPGLRLQQLDLTSSKQHSQRYDVPIQDEIGEMEATGAEVASTRNCKQSPLHTLRSGFLGQRSNSRIEK